MNTIVVLEPIGRARVVEQTLAERPADLGGRRLGLLDDNKANAGLLLETLAGLLGDRFNMLGGVPVRKPQAPIALSPEETETLSACDGVLLAVCD